MNNMLLDNKIFNNVVTIIFFWILIRIIIYIITDFSDVYGGDSGYYISVGSNIVNHGIHGSYSSILDSIIPTSYRPPLYSIFTGFIISISKNPLLIYIFQSIIFLLFSIACYMILRRKYRKLALLSAILIALSPSDALYNGRLLSENIVTPLLVLSSLYFVFSKGHKEYLFSGILIGATVLTRDVYLLLPFFIVFIGFFVKIPMKHLIIYLFGFLIIVTPWVIRNANLDNNSGAHVSKGIMWSNIWAGTWIEDHNDVISKDNVPKKALNTLNSSITSDEFLVIWGNRGDYEDFFKDASIKYISNNPLKVLDVWISRYHLLWMGTRSDLFNFDQERYSTAWYVMKSIFYLINTIVVFAFIIGLYLAVKFKHKILLLSAPIVYSALIYVPFYNIETRYTQPIYPIILIYMAYALLYLKKLLIKEQV